MFEIAPEWSHSWSFPALSVATNLNTWKNKCVSLVCGTSRAAAEPGLNSSLDKTKVLETSVVFVNEKDVLVCAVAPPGLLKVPQTGAANSIWIGRVVVVNALCGSVEATDHHKVALVLWFPAEALLSHWEEAAVFDRRRTQLTGQHHGVDQDNGHVTLLQVRLDLLHRHWAFLHYDAFALRF